MTDSAFTVPQTDEAGTTRSSGSNGSSDSSNYSAQQIAGLLAEKIDGASKPKLFRDVAIDRTGESINIPEGMSLEVAGQWIEKRRIEEETEVAVVHMIECFPLEGAYALKKALEKIFDFVKLDRTPTMFGSNPPQQIQLEIAPGVFEQVPWGRMSPEGLEGYFETYMDLKGQPMLVIEGRVKRKHEKLVADVVKLTEDLLRVPATEGGGAIYRGRAIRMDLSFLRRGEDSQAMFDPKKDAPKFLDIGDISREDLIVDDVTMTNILTSIMLRIEQKEACRANGIPLKHGVLLTGPYGTGKTMTAKVVAKVSEENGWTFAYFANPLDFADSIRFIAPYAPAVVFVEDIDKIVSDEEGRTDAVNKIFNTLDGIDTKSLDIIVVMTTNHPERIHPGFLRAGRVDTVISMERPSPELAIQFVKSYARDDEGNSILSDKISEQEWDEIGRAMSSYAPAFIAEAVQKAKLLGMYRAASADIKGLITAKDLVNSALAIADHVKLAYREDLVESTAQAVERAEAREADKGAAASK